MPLSAAGAISFAKELGIGAGNAGYFVGVSPEMRNALRDAIPKGVTVLSVPTPPEILSNYQIDPDHLKTPDFAIATTWVSLA